MSDPYVQGQPSAYQNNSWWRWGQSVDGERFLFNMLDTGAPYDKRSGGSIYEFDASKALDGDLSDAFREVAWIGASDLGVTYADGRVFFVRRSDGLYGPKIDAVGGNGEYWDPAHDNGVRLHLYSVDVDSPGAITDWGKITDSGGRVPWRLEGVSAGQGHVYMTGDWVMKQTDPIEWRTLRHDGGTSTTYTLRICGQAFLVADTPLPPMPGDTDRDGDVDLDDLSTLASNWNTPTGMTWADGDFDGNGGVGLNDLSILAANWNEGVTGAGSVPEPVTLMMLAAAAPLLLRPRRRA
jgi:hypothetical protein